MASPFPTPGPPTITFLGRVIPEAVNFYFTKVLEYEWPMENGLRVMMRPSINKSIIRVECYANRNNPEDIMALHMRAMDISRAIVNLACFSSGHGAQVVLDKLITSAGAEKTLVIRDQRIAAFATSFSLATQPNSDLDKMLGVVLMEPPLFMALDDLIASIALPHHAPINCARAIDAIRNMIAPGLSTSKQWAALRENLNVSKDYLKLKAHLVSHGSVLGVPKTWESAITAYRISRTCGIGFDHAVPRSRCILIMCVVPTRLQHLLGWLTGNNDKSFLSNIPKNLLGYRSRHQHRH